jgi:hypothetical protein
MAYQGVRFLQNVYIKRIIQTLASQLEAARPLVYRNRLPRVNALDDELVGRFTGSILAADIVADDQVAVVQDAGKLELVTTQIPNLKHGQFLPQRVINFLRKMQRGEQNVQEENFLEVWFNETLERLIYGIAQRENMLAAGMFMDLANYNRLGIVMQNVTWGMPANLKVTTGVAWTDATNATPISDLMALDQVTNDNYGFMFNRYTMSSVAFRQMTATAEFAAKATLTFGAHLGLSANNIMVKDTPRMLNLASQLFGGTKEFVLDDATFQERSNAGAKNTTRYLPTNKVILDVAEHDQDGQFRDLANGEVTEALVADLLGSAANLFGPMDLGGPTETYGPIGYYTGNPDLNPPNLSAWAVARSFPRKHHTTCSAVLTVA